MDDLPGHSFQTLLQDMATLTKNRVRFTMNESSAGASTDLPAQPALLQQRAFALLGLSPTL